MLVKFKRSRTHSEDRKLALCLATSAGLLNAIALGAFGFFPSHMSGNVSQLPAEMTDSNLWHLKVFALLITAFVAGAVVARIGIVVGMRNGVRTIFSCLLLAEGIALLLTSLFEIFFFTPENNAEVVLLLAFLMGVHNSTSTQLSNGRVRSTHITGTLTDAGIAVGSVVSTCLRGAGKQQESGSRQQLNTHLITIFSFLCGGVVGLLLFNFIGLSSLAIPGVVLISAAAVSILMTVIRVRRGSYAASL